MKDMLHIRAEKEIKEQLQVLADKRGMTVSQLARWILKEYLKEF